MHPKILIYSTTVLIVYLLYKIIHGYVRRKNRRQERAAGRRDKRTILVCMLCENQYATVATMAFMLESALNPAQMRFALVQPANDTSIDLFELLQRANANKAYVVREEQVRCLVLRNKTPPPYGEAMNLCLSLGQGETFVLFTQPGAVFCKNFDKALKAHHQSNIALTCHGPVFYDTNFKHPPGKSKNILNYMAATMPGGLLAISEESSFFGFHTDGTLVRFLCPSKQSNMIRSVGLSALCTFLENGDLVFETDAPTVCPHVTLSKSFLTYEFFNLHVTLAYQGKHTSTNHAYSINDENVLGIGLGRVMLGLTNDYDSREITTKFGTLVNLEKQKVKLNIS